ncbi:zinc-dependent metalloprotease [Flavobacterium psychrotrophum]|uniref:zinc-dependent metalloprotease n=1 Tax=Flavobacterium psychrotrophum TaxID=2294119 RepID=UPI0013C461BA|nr:zinc-dependent metalloprotease [Flavobacterium psychrotrophum]
MKKILFLLALLNLNSISAQDLCGTDARHRQLLATDAVYAKRVKDFDSKPHTIKKRSTSATPTYVIPVVVHVMHKGEDIGTGTNISDAVVRDQIKRMNLVYRNKNGGQGVDTKIEFALAVRNPHGGCTNGIDRIDMTSDALYMDSGVAYQSGIGISDAVLKNRYYWDTNQYYNIWVVSEFDNGTSTYAGYAYYASTHGRFNDGAVILASEIINPSSVTVEHELGHALNLYHTFEGDTNGTRCPDEANGCGNGAGDCCADTAPHIRFTNCFTITDNSCSPGNNDFSYTHNYMTYSSVNGCQDMFTMDQKERMISALTDVRGSLLAENGNMSLVPPMVSSPDFTVSPSVACQAGQTVQLRDLSSCIPNTFMDESQWPGITFNWTISNQNNTYTLSGQNKEFVLPEAGTYTVTLTVTTPEGSAVAHREQAIIVAASAPPAACTPIAVQSGRFGYTINKVTFNSIDNNTSGQINDNYQDFACTHSTVVTPGTTYPLILSVRSGNQYPEIFRVYIDYNNNGIFEETELIAAGSNPATTNNMYITDITIPQTAVQNTLLRMRVIGEAQELTASELNCSSAFLVGDIEDYGVYIDGNLGTEHVQKSNFNVYPNPVTNILSVKGNTVINNAKLYNMLGQLVIEKQLNSADAALDVSALNNGAYLLQITSGDKTQTSKIIKQ